MNELIKAILEEKPEQVRQILQDDVNLTAKHIEPGKQPITIAKNKGVKRIEVLFVRYTDWTNIYTNEELKDLLVALISELSEECYSAGWLKKIENELWNIINQRADLNTLSLWNKRSNIKSIEDLDFLKNITNSWAIWDEALEKAVPIDLDEWIKNN